jgi:hypothetical protein
MKNFIGGTMKNFSNYNGIRIPKNVIKYWVLNNVTHHDLVRKELVRKELEVFNILTLSIDMDLVRLIIRERMCGSVFVYKVSLRNLEELDRLEVTERVLNELK